MQGHAQKSVERYLELAKCSINDLSKVSTPNLDDHQLHPDDFNNPGELVDECAKVVLKALYLARMERPDILWAVNALARNVTKWTKACDRRLHRLISYIYTTKHYVQFCYVGDHVEDCVIVMFCDASFAGDLSDSKSTSGIYVCLVDPSTFVPLSCICKKQGAVSHSSSEAEIISLDAGLRMEAIPILQLWDVIIDVFGPQIPVSQTTHSRGQTTQRVPDINSTQKVPVHEKSYGRFVRDILLNVDYVPYGLPKVSSLTRLVIMEDNDAVIKMIMKGRHPTLRHVARTHRVDLDSLIDIVRNDPSIFIKYVKTNGGHIN